MDLDAHVQIQLPVSCSPTYMYSFISFRLLYTAWPAAADPASVP